ncbi:MAG: hypothetical protein ABI619_12710 [Betaproteobacteria bacterium]
MTEIILESKTSKGGEDSTALGNPATENSESTAIASLAKLFEISRQYGDASLEEILKPDWNDLFWFSWTECLPFQLKEVWESLPQDVRVALYIQAAFTDEANKAHFT